MSAISELQRDKILFLSYAGLVDFDCFELSEDILSAVSWFEACH